MTTPKRLTLFERPLGDGRELTVIPLTYGRARLTVGPAGAGYYADAW